MKNHKNVYKLQLKNKLKYYRSPWKPKPGILPIEMFWRSPQPPLFHKECVYQDLKSSQHRLKQKISKKKAWISFAHELTGASNSSLEIVL